MNLFSKLSSVTYLAVVIGVSAPGAWPACLSDTPPPPVVALIDDKPGPALPDVPTQPVPATPPLPGQNIAIVLAGDRQYVTRWKARFDLECFPDASLINIESAVLDDKAGEKVFRIFGRFVDGEPALQWRKFTDQYLTIITAKEGAVGQVDVLFIVDGQTKPRKRVTLAVNGGAPTPPPVVVPPVVGDPLAVRFQAAYDLETVKDANAVAKLARVYHDVYASIVNKVASINKLATFDDFGKTLRVATETEVDGKLMKLRYDIGLYLNSAVKVKPSDPFDDAAKSRTAQAADAISKALERVK